jgi:hypothetical protein
VNIFPGTSNWNFQSKNLTRMALFLSRVGWKKPVWKKPLVLTGKNQTEKPRHFKGKTGFSWVFGGFFNFYKDFAKIIYFKNIRKQ